MTRKINLTVCLLCAAACVNRNETASAIQALITAAPASIPADGKTTATLTVLASANGAALPADALVELTSTDQKAVIKQPVGPNEAGQYVASISSTDVGDQTVTGAARLGRMVVSLGTCTVVHFYAPTAGIPNALQSSIVASPTTARADGTTTVTVTVTAKDFQGRPINAQPVSLSSTGSNYTFMPAMGNTNASGVFTATMVSTTAEAKTVTATFGPVTATTGVDFTTVPGITVSPTTALTTSETGTTATFTVVLQASPTADVTIELSSSDTTQDNVSPATLTFTAANWDTAQTVTVTGVDNHLYSGSGTATIVTAAAASTDVGYSGMNPPDVPVTNLYSQPIPTVGAMYSNAALWSSYVKNDGPNVYTATNTACAGTEAGDYTSCLHGGEMRVLAMVNWNSCTNLTASDAAGIFSWTCDTSLGYVRWVTAGLASGRYLTSLIDFATHAWMANTVTVKNAGTTLFTTAPAAWWGNTITPVTGTQTLGTANTVYTIDSNINFGGAATGFTINGDNVSLAINPNNAIEGATTLVSTANAKFLWLEGTFDGSSSTTTGLSLTGVKESVVNNTKISNCSSGTNPSALVLDGSTKNKLNGVTVANSGSATSSLTTCGGTDGMSVLVTASSNYNTINAMSISNSLGKGLVLTGSTHNTVDGLAGTQISTSYLCLDANANYNSFNAVTGTYVGRAVYAMNSSHNLFRDLHFGAVLNSETLLLASESYDVYENVTSFSTNEGVNIGGSSNHVYLHNIIIEGTNTVWTFMLFGVNDNVLANIISLNTGGGTGESYYDPIALHGSNNNLVLNCVASNSLTAFDLDGQNNTLVNIAATNAQTAIYVDPGATGNQFNGSLILGGNPNSCFAPSTAGNGLQTPGGTYSTNCTVDATLSTATLTQGVDLSTSFVGPVTSGDVSNSSDSNGAATYSTAMDWLNFSVPNRGWGIDATSMLAPGTRSPCNSSNASCRIYDVNLVATDNKIRGILAKPTTGNETATHTWSDNTTSTFLLNAVEVEGDGIGNDNLMCESGETCMYTPNIGVYQGHGAINGAGTLGTTGTVKNVSLLQYSTNGY